MNWLIETILEPSMVQTVIIISLVASIGLVLGRIKIFGVSLGITFVFFTGILAGHLNIPINKDIIDFAQNFGLVIFVYTLGLQVGPGFFSSFKKGGMQMNMLAMGVVSVSMLLMMLFYFVADVSLPNMVGILSGAVTNTPALGAAQQALVHLGMADDKAISDMGTACAVTYPLGVVGVILAIVFLRKFLDNSADSEVKVKKDTTTYIGEFQVCNPAIYDKRICDVMHLTNRHFIISRVWSDGKVSIPTSETKLQPKDHLLIISIKSDVENIKVLFGEQEKVDWNKEDIDWNRIDNSQLVSRRIIVTRDKVNGIKLGTLRLRNLYGINITRVNRAGIDLLASPNLTLQMGDKLTVVGEAASINNVGNILGNEIKRLKEPNLVAVFLGILLGMLLGALPIPIPGMTLPIRLGIAGGPIIVGILMGAFGPRFHLTTYTTQSANLMVRQLGIVTYLAGLGISSGSHFFETVFRTEGLLWIGIGFLLTLLPILIVGILAMKLLKIDYANCIGMLCGSIANPIALNYANTTVEGDEPSVTYATVYPLSMFVRVISAQLIIMLFM